MGYVFFVAVIFYLMRWYITYYLCYFFCSAIITLSFMQVLVRTWIVQLALIHVVMMLYVVLLAIQLYPILCIAPITNAHILPLLEL